MTDATTHHLGSYDRATVIGAVRHIRDLTVLDVAGGALVVACDSIGGIGPKPDDTVAVPATTTAHFATRVPLLEVVCAGARPALIVDTLCVELDPHGHDMIAAVRELGAEVGLPGDRVTGTTEDNVPTRATGIGVTVIGEVVGPLRPGTSRADDVVVCLGQPHSAPEDEVIVGGERMIALGDLRKVLDLGVVHDALPVGSRGLTWEIEQLATTAGLRAAWRDGHGLDVTKSGGPSTCVLVSCPREAVEVIGAHLPRTLPVAVVADLVCPTGETHEAAAGRGAGGVD